MGSANFSPRSGNYLARRAFLGKSVGYRVRVSLDKFRGFLGGQRNVWLTLASLKEMYGGNSQQFSPKL
jgi:hypothetical protein